MAKADGLSGASDLLCSVQHDHHTQVLRKGVIQTGKGVFSLSLSLASVLNQMRAIGRGGVDLTRNWTILESEIKPKHGNSCFLFFGLLIMRFSQEGHHK